MLPEYVPALPVFLSWWWCGGLPLGHGGRNASFSPLVLFCLSTPAYLEDNGKGQTKPNKVLRNSAKYDILSLEETNSQEESPTWKGASYYPGLASPTCPRVFPKTPRPSTATSSSYTPKGMT